ncbi:hypothetical protein JHK82_044530 [Glycine max]|nr:hypothetical protein JHK82_044530 [Glycine max]
MNESRRWYYTNMSFTKRVLISIDKGSRRKREDHVRIREEEGGYWRYALHSIDMHFIVIDLRRSSWSPVDELVADVNFPIGPSSKTPMHTITEMVSPKMVVVLLDHHVDANIHIMEDMTPLDILITLTSNFILDNPTHIEP